VHVLTEKEQNMRFRNKLTTMISTMMTRPALEELLKALAQPKPKLRKLYRCYERQFRPREGAFRKELKALALQSKHML
jgi:hypothetical protein